MIILNNWSSDDSLKIIHSLQNENLPVTVIEDEDAYYNQNGKMTWLLKKAVYQYGADVVCPLDADEFISCDVCNPREILEGIGENSYCLVRWQTYVSTANDDVDVKFIPLRVRHVRDENYDLHYKVIVSRNMVVNFDVSLDMGSHNLVFNNSQEKITPIRLFDLRIAHFP